MAVIKLVLGERVNVLFALYMLCLTLQCKLDNYLFP